MFVLPTVPLPAGWRAANPHEQAAYFLRTQVDQDSIVGWDGPTGTFDVRPEDTHQKWRRFPDNSAVIIAHPPATPGDTSPKPFYWPWPVYIDAHTAPFVPDAAAITTTQHSIRTNPAVFAWRSMRANTPRAYFAPLLDHLHALSRAAEALCWMAQVPLVTTSWSLLPSRIEHTGLLVPPQADIFGEADTDDPKDAAIMSTAFQAAQNAAEDATAAFFATTQRQLRALQQGQQPQAKGLVHDMAFYPLFVDAHTQTTTSMHQALPAMAMLRPYLPGPYWPPRPTSG